MRPLGVTLTFQRELEQPFAFVFAQFVKFGGEVAIKLRYTKGTAQGWRRHQVNQTSLHHDLAHERSKERNKVQHFLKTMLHFIFERAVSYFFLLAYNAKATARTTVITIV